MNVLSKDFFFIYEVAKRVSKVEEKAKEQWSVQEGILVQDNGSEVLDGNLPLAINDKKPPLAIADKELLLVPAKKVACNSLIFLCWHL